MSSATHDHHHRTRYHRGAAAGMAALVLVVNTALPSSARQDAGESRSGRLVTENGSCAIARVDQQFVKCDDLTGNGVAAPGWVPEL